MPKTNDVVISVFLQNAWHAKEGYDPIAKGKLARRCSATRQWLSKIFIGELVILLLYMLLTLKGRSFFDPDIPTPMILVIIGTFFISVPVDMLMEVWRGQSQKQFDNFDSRLQTLADCLKVPKYQLGDISLLTAAVARIKEMAEYIFLIEKIEGSEAEANKQGLRKRLQDHFQEFKYWHLISVDDRLSQYFPVR